ncbi:MAG TPA: hemolysin III family channel protein, partial [Erysipelotrichaceae bacterium]|nr:hemolysin III family channel protein [Erysipelotrichaceae bacterium]
IMDHDTIFVLIAGTYTPILLVTIREADPFWAWTLLAIVWGISILGIVLNSIDIERFKVFSMICYLGLGWCIVFKFNLLLSHMALNGIILLVAGGVAYTVGCIFYKLGDTKKYMHSIWHIWILIGALCHFLTILLYVI